MLVAIKEGITEESASHIIFFRRKSRFFFNGISKEALIARGVEGGGVCEKKAIHGVKKRRITTPQLDTAHNE